MKYEFEVPSKIIGKGRPRLNTYTGIVYTPTRTKDYEELIKQYFKVYNKSFTMLEGRIKIDIKACFEIPKSEKKQTKIEMLEGKISPTKKPDIDNIVKIILDAMNDFVFKDDTQVTMLNVEKLYAQEEKIIVTIEEY